MKAFFTLFTFTFFIGIGFGQNLKPERVSSIEIDVPPLNLDYLSVTKIFVQPSNWDEFNGRSALVNKFNRRIYTLTNSMEESELYVNFIVTRIPRKTATATSSNATRTDKKGNKITTTTYMYEGAEEIDVTINLMLPNGAMVKSYSGSSSLINYKGTSTNSYKEANQYYMSDRNQKAQNGFQTALDAAYNKLANEYLINSKNFDIYAIGVKSRKQDYSDINDAAALLTTWFASSPTDMSSPDIIKAIKLYDDALFEHNPDDRKARIDNEVAAVCYYQKAAIAFYLKNYKQAEEWVLKSEELDRRIHFSQENLKYLVTLLRERKVFN